MYIVIYEKATGKIVRVIKQTEKIVSYGYSDNCSEKHLEELPKTDHIEL